MSPRDFQVFICNDYMTCIPGTRTLWHDLMDHFRGKWIGGDYGNIPNEKLFQHMQSGSINDCVLIRNATYFPWIPTGNNPVISLVQDICTNDYQRAMQLNVCANSDHVVFNSLHTLRAYPEVKTAKSVISLGVDDRLFCLPHADDGVTEMDSEGYTGDVLWIGSTDHIKSPHLVLEIARKNPDIQFTCVMKHFDPDPDWQWPDNVCVAMRLTHADLIKLMHRHKIGLCTSREETQHLAGIEMALCGLQMVAPPVGIYKNVPEADVCQWAIVDRHENLARIVALAANDPWHKESVRKGVQEMCPTVSQCMDAWERLARSVMDKKRNPK
jgi:hypothetical protein